MELLRQVWSSDNMDDVWRRCEVWLPRSLTGRAVLVGVVAGVVVYYVTKKRYKLPPGPHRWPLLGNLLEFQQHLIYKKLIEWGKIHGPVVSFRVGPIQMVGVNSTEAALEVLVKKSTDFAGRIQTYSTYILSEGGKSIGLGDYGPTWKLHRKLATKALRYYMSGARLEEGMERSLKRGAQLIRQQKGAFNPHNIISSIVFNIINNICFNFTCEIDDEYFIKLLGMMDDFNEVFANGLVEDFIPPLRLFPTKKMRQFIKICKDTFDEFNNNINKHKKTFSKDCLRDFCDAMLLAQLEAQEEEDPGLLANFTDSHVTQTMIDIFSAGLDTSRYTLMWSLLYLAANPRVQELVHKEVDQAFGSRKYPKMSDRPNLPYTEAVLHEVLRMASVTPLSVPHTAMEDSTIGNYDIQKGTVIFINQYAIHHDPQYWKDPETFRPERFLDGNGKIAPKPDSWLPFSAGRRMCLGESVAKPELHLMLAGLFRQFKVTPPPGVALSTEPKEWSFLSMPKAFDLVMKSRI